MTEECDCPPEAGNTASHAATNSQPSHPAIVCPECHQLGKSVEGQTVKALLSVSLRAILATDYRFCRISTCAVVYFAGDGTHHFTTDQLRERVYQKQPEENSVLICYCFRHTAGHVRTSTAKEQAAIVANITAGIKSEQCACDLRNPQGSCCLGNVRELINHNEKLVKEQWVVLLR